MGGYASRVPVWIVTAYLTSKDDHLVDNSGSLLLQELADDVVTKRAGSNDGEVLVSRHVLATWGHPCFALLYLCVFFAPVGAFVVALTKPLI